MTAALLLAALLAADAAPARPLIGDPAPDAAGLTLDGRALGRDALVGGITIVEFFATWCVPCHRSLEDIAAVRAELAAAGAPPVRLLLVDAAEPADTVRRYLREHPVPPGTTVALDPGGQAARRWGRDRLPTTFVLDGDGIVRHINRGHGSGFRARLRRWLRVRLAAQHPAP